MPEYLDILLDGIDASPLPLAPVMGRVWGQTPTEANIRYDGGPMCLFGAAFFPEGKQPAQPEQLATDLNFVRQQAQLDHRAARYSTFYLAHTYGARRAGERETLSWFDQQRIKAAKQACGTEQMLYVKGAIVGIQRYIYHDINAEQIGDAKNVSKRLRGRSFLVAILGELLAGHLVERLGLEQANVLFVGGGHFNLLLPASAADILTKTVWGLNEELLREYGLRLGLVVAHETVSATDLDKDFRRIFLETNHRLELGKNKRYAAELKPVFEELGERSLSEADEKKILDAQERLGGAIPHATFLLEVAGTLPERETLRAALQADHSWFAVDALELDLYVLTIEWKDVPAVLAVVAEKMDMATAPLVKLHRLNSLDFLPPAAQHPQLAAYPVGYGFRLLGQAAPMAEETQEGNTKRKVLQDLSTVAALNAKGEICKSYNKLAAIRLDVDDLGSLFAQGLNSAEGLVEVMALSREMQLFFGGYINQLAKEHHTYIVYSGGDDAFALASWENALNFLLELRMAFYKFTQDNSELGFSAGIRLANPKYPIARLAADAGEEERKAKAFPTGDSVTATKDAIQVFGHAMSWGQFLSVLGFGKKLAKSMMEQSTKIKRSLLQHLLAVIQAAHAVKASREALVGVTTAENNADAEFEFYRNLGRLHAMFARRGLDEDQLAKLLLQEMKDFNNFQNYIVPLHYALYITKENRKG